MPTNTGHPNAFTGRASASCAVCAVARVRCRGGEGGGTRRFPGGSLYTPGIRRHVAAALAHGATIEEIMEVLKLCGAQGVDACELGAPILTEELANHQKNTETL